MKGCGDDILEKLADELHVSAQRQRHPSAMQRGERPPITKMRMPYPVAGTAVPYYRDVRLECGEVDALGIGTRKYRKAIVWHAGSMPEGLGRRRRYPATEPNKAHRGEKSNGP